MERNFACILKIYIHPHSQCNLYSNAYTNLYISCYKQISFYIPYIPYSYVFRNGIISCIDLNTHSNNE